MSREGLWIIVGLILGSGVITAGAIITPFIHLTIMAILCIALTGFTIFFFRDPKRIIPDVSNTILSPADGKVIEIQDEFEKEYINAPSTRISIFLSLFDVHINRIPLAGTIGYFQYQQGSYIKAYKSEASTFNEQTIIGIENNQAKILFKQIAGILARRIVCNVREGNVVKLGERFGMIKFGSRVDIFLPKYFEIKVQLNQKVKGGLSILGVMNNDK
ncbi:MAG: phosphatidylserine decarboxylase family protein [bacterium]